MNENVIENMQQYEDAATFFEAFAEPARIHLIHILHKYGEQNITALQLHTRYTQVKVSRHMLYLKGRNVVKVKRSGKERFYQINYSHKQMKVFIALLETTWLSEN